MEVSDKDLVSRRGFMKTAAGAGALVAAPMIVPSSVLGQQAGAVPPSDRVVVGGIGLGMRGASDLKDLLTMKSAQFVAICDVKSQRREEIKTVVDQAYGNHDCAMYEDQFELLAREDIDAVLIATGDRWHALLAIIAAQHGKDVYCEKPGAATIGQALAVIETFHEYGRIYQGGSQRHDTENMIFALELARTGKLGKLQAVHAQVCGPPERPVVPIRGWLPPEPEPVKQVLDWDRWLGPAPWRPYNSIYVTRGEGGWYNFWDFYGGGILEWGPHSGDLCQAAANADDTNAVEYDPEVKEAGPVVINCRYANGVKLVMRDSGWLPTVGGCCARFEGDAGWVESGSSGVVELSPNLLAKFKAAIPVKASQSTVMHLQNWLDCVKSRQQPHCNVDATMNNIITNHAAYISWQVRRKLTWDPATKSFVNDDEANRMRSRAMREPWHI
jgi:hypothetical protein